MNADTLTLSKELHVLICGLFAEETMIMPKSKKCFAPVDNKTVIYSSRSFKMLYFPRDFIVSHFVFFKGTNVMLSFQVYN